MAFSSITHSMSIVQHKATHPVQNEADEKATLSRGFYTFYLPSQILNESEHQHSHSHIQDHSEPL